MHIDVAILINKYNLTELIIYVGHQNNWSTSESSHDPSVNRNIICFLFLYKNIICFFYFITRKSDLVAPLLVNNTLIWFKVDSLSLNFVNTLLDSNYTSWSVPIHNGIWSMRVKTLQVNYQFNLNIDISIMLK